MIYLDHNASTELRKPAHQVMLEVLDITGNPSAVHKAGRQLRSYIESARDELAKAVNAGSSENVVFTSGASEANACVLHGFPDVKTVLVSATEHPSVKSSRDDAVIIPVDQNSLLDMGAFKKLLEAHKDQGPMLVSVGLVNGENGVIQPIQEITALAHEYGAIMHTDAAQALSRISVDMQDLGVDALTLSAHKMGGPQGVGALIVKTGVTVAPLLRGGKQEKGRRAGTENAAAIASFGAAVKEAVADISRFQALSVLRDKMEEGLRTLNSDIVIHGENAPRTSNTCFFSSPGLDSQALVIALELEGVAVSAGSACSSGSTRKSTTLTAIGAPDEELCSVLRVSLGWSSTEDDINGFLAAWQKVCTRMRAA